MSGYMKTLLKRPCPTQAKVEALTYMYANSANSENNDGHCFRDVTV